MRHINAGLENDRFRQSDTVGNTGAGHGKVAASGTRLNTYEAPTPRTHGGSNGTWVRRIAADAGKPCIDSGGDNDPASDTETRAVFLRPVAELYYAALCVTGV